MYQKKCLSIFVVLHHITLCEATEFTGTPNYRLLDKVTQKPLAGAVDGIQTALGCNTMLHYVLVNRKFNELKSMILLSDIFFSRRFEQGPYSSRRAEALPLAIEQSTTRDAESEKV